MSPDTIPAFLNVDCEMAGHIGGFDWSTTPLGPPVNWPESLQAAVRQMLGCGHPMLIWWGEQRIQLYNDAHAPSLGPEAHPGALGRPGPEVWRDGWHVFDPQIGRVLAGEKPGWYENHPVPMTRNGVPETTHWTYSLNAIPDPAAANGVGGVMLIGAETSGAMRALREATARLAARTEAYSEVALQNARLAAVVAASEQFLGFASPDGTVREANPAALRAVHATLPEVAGLKFWDAPWFNATPGMSAQVAADFERAATGAMVRRELHISLPTGPRAFDFALHPVHDEYGTLTGIVAAATELTEWRNTEEKRCQAQKMEAIGQLTGGLAHDFNNLLTGISGSLDLLKTRIAQGRAHEAGRYIEAAETSAARAADLTHRLLAFSRRQTLDPKPTAANALIAGMEDALKRTIGPLIALELRLEDGLWPIFCDARQLESAILNLCLNARDAMPDGGTLCVQTENITLDAAQARARDMLAGPYVVIGVTDTGNGMSPEVAARAFDPFYTTKPIGLGTGLGLSMIYGFTQQSGGQVRIHTGLGQGTTMRLFLPRYAADAGNALPPAPPLPGQARARAGETVLVVDDEPTVRMLVIEVLEELGYAALEAPTGAAGLKILNSPARVDLLISDVGLPGGMNGRQMADAARARRADLKVLFITGYAETAVIGNGSLGPGMEVMTKPFSLEALALRIKAMTSDSEKMNR
jgi:signal transduction histidine kinase/CheY-like chemotaxis protein